MIYLVFIYFETVQKISPNSDTCSNTCKLFYFLSQIHSNPELSTQIKDTPYLPSELIPSLS